MEIQFNTNPHSKEFKENYVKLLASGLVESQILKLLNLEWVDFFEAVAVDPDFREDIALAKKERASRWVEKIGESLYDQYYKEEVDDEGRVFEVPRAPNKDELARDKLNFERLKFLAQADDPERYGSAGGKAKVDVNLNMGDIQLLSPQESIRVLSEDPFRHKKDIVVDVDKITGLDVKELSDGKEESN